MANEVWCFHSHPPEPLVDLQEGLRVEGVVVCVHPYGLGVHLRGGEFGHENATAMGRTSMAPLEDYPLIGESLALEVLGYAGPRRQLRLRVVT